MHSRQVFFFLAGQTPSYMTVSVLHMVSGASTERASRPTTGNILGQAGQNTPAVTSSHVSSYINANLWLQSLFVNLRLAP